MTVIVRHGAAQRARKAPQKAEGKLARHRREYDARRRAHEDTLETKLYSAVIRKDPCSYCRDGHCGQMASDHIVPLDQGGADDWTNLTSAGRPCNASKKNKPLLHWMLERIDRGTTR